MTIKDDSRLRVDFPKSKIIYLTHQECGNPLATRALFDKGRKRPGLSGFAGRKPDLGDRRFLKKREHDMTLCIAATCYDPYPPPLEELNVGRVRLDPNMAVVSWDMRIHDTISAADIGRKIIGLTPTWCCLIAGTMHVAAGLARSCGTELSRVSDGVLDESNLVERILTGIRWYVAEQYLTSVYGIHYNDLLTNENDRVSTELVTRFVDEVANLAQPTGVELVFVGWIKTRFVIAYYIGGECLIDDHFAVIGSGYPMAQQMLYAREQRSFTPFLTTIYNVYEAQRLGSSHRDVGTEARMSILRYDRFAKCVVHSSVSGPPGGFFDELFKKTWIHPELNAGMPAGLLGTEMPFVSLEELKKANEADEA